eukprot:1037376-Pleurochrysis_carterae.AAC.1
MPYTIDTRMSSNGHELVVLAHLQPTHEGSAQFASELWRRGKAFVRSAPSLVLWRGKARSKSPVHAAQCSLSRCGRSDGRGERNVARAAQAHVVWEDCCVCHEGIAMHSIDANQQRNPQTVSLRRPLELGAAARKLRRVHLKRT